jgi:penicillin amidase
VSLSKPVKISLWTVGVILTLLLAIVVALWWVLRGSLATLEGQQTVNGISQVVTIERDQQGLVTLAGDNRADIAFALGYVHAQERLFQMDLLRKNSAGELSQLFGGVAANFDGRIRVHQFRKRAELAFERLPTYQKTLLESYANGVNEGRAGLSSAPFEYLVLQTGFEEWRAEDAFLVVFSMFMDLQNEWAEGERSMAAMSELLPTDWFEFLMPLGGEWDSTIDQTDLIYQGDFPSVQLAQFQTGNEYQVGSRYYDEIMVGSNNWSVNGSLTEHGAALVADDMHLGLDVPNIWFRASWYLPDEDRRITGATLPGTPLMVIGSTENVAWGFTNSYGDYIDLIKLRTNAENTEYLTEQGWTPFTIEKETILVKGAEAQTVDIKKTKWGPVIGEDHYGNLLAMRWMVHDTEAANLTLLEMEYAGDVNEAVDIAARTGIPGQNLNVGDRYGNHAWTIMGAIPERFGFETYLERKLPQDWSTGLKGWKGILPADQYPKVINPDTNRLWTANARIVGGAMADIVGDGLAALGPRQQQIETGLFDRDRFNESDFLEIHLDDRAVFLARWQALIMDLLPDEKLAGEFELALFRTEVDNWSARADKDSVGYLLVKRYREKVIDQTVGHVFRYLENQTEHFWTSKVDNKVEYPVWKLVTEQPSAHLPDGYDSWDAFLVGMAKEVISDLTQDGSSLLDHKWGAHNMLSIVHPMSGSVPLLRYLTDMKSEPMSGDTFMPRVQGKSSGASQRMSVAPGHEASGYFHMATGQSGHPLSPFFGNGHEDWVDGTPTSFLPGETRYVLELVPQ